MKYWLVLCLLFAIPELYAQEMEIHDFDIGAFRSDNEDGSRGFIIGGSTIEKRKIWWERSKASGNDYYRDSIIYAEWKNRRPPVPRNYHAEVLPDLSEELTTKEAVERRAKFAPGYRVWVEDTEGFWFGRFNRVEMLFDNKALISVMANTDTAFYMVMTRHFGPPEYKEKTDTVAWKKNPKVVALLKTRTYRWEKGDNRVDVILTDDLGDNGLKYTSALCHLSDAHKYALYLDAVEEERVRLMKAHKIKISR